MTASVTRNRPAMRLAAPALAAAPARPGRSTAVRILATLGTVVGSAAVLIVLWYIAVSVLPISPFIAKRPIDVWNYLVVGGVNDDASAHRAELFGLLGVTLGHAALGFVLGVGGSVAVAVLFVLVRPLEFMFMPMAMILRTVPLLAIAPAIYLIFGAGWVTAGLIGGIVVFFPILVNLTVGLRSVSPQAVDLVSVYGGNRWTIMRKIAFPTALPYFFASLRIAVPGAITGAMLYEWLFTFEGLGAAITTAKSASQYDKIWSIVVLITVVSIVAYTIAAAVETAVLAKWGPNAGRTSSFS